jgi:hypothetical protein
MVIGPLSLMLLVVLSPGFKSPFELDLPVEFFPLLGRGANRCDDFVRNIGDVIRCGRLIGVVFNVEPGAGNAVRFRFSCGGGLRENIGNQKGEPNYEQKGFLHFFHGLSLAKHGIGFKGGRVLAAYLNSNKVQ